MKVCGFKSNTSERPTFTVAVSAWNSRRRMCVSQRSASLSATRNPRLCLVILYFSPGLPSPATQNSLLLLLLLLFLVFLPFCLALGLPFGRRRCAFGGRRALGTRNCGGLFVRRRFDD